MILHIKNMVCHRCIMAVENALKELDFVRYKISMGQVNIENSQITTDKKKTFIERITKLGFELIDDKKSKIIESIKNIVVHNIHYAELSNKNILWSELISNHLHYEYKYLSRLFSSIAGVTIEQFVILQKIEKVKDLIVYNELTLSEIAWILNYRSLPHLSNQFKKITGMTPKNFKELGAKHRKSLDKV